MSQSMVKACLESLAERDGGRLTPDAVVEAARDPTSPLHDHFTWDDTLAAQKCRLDEARTLIRSIRVVVRTSPLLVQAPQFVRDPTLPTDQQGYVSIGRLMNDEERSRLVVVEEFARASAALARAKVVAISLNMTEEIEELEAQLRDVATRAAQQASA